MDMTNEELALAIQQGRTELMEPLWEQVRGFVYRKARAAMAGLKSGCGVELNDLLNSGYIALDSAAQTYDIEKCSFITWLSYCLRTAFQRYGGYPTFERNPQAESHPWENYPKWVYHNPLNGSTSLYTPLKAGDPEEGALADVVPCMREDGGDDYTDVEDEVYREQLHDALECAIDTLPEAQAKALRGRYWDDLQYSELAEACGVSPEQARKDVYAGIRALKSPVLRHELEQFLEDRTDYYRGSGLQSFRNKGSSSVERVVAQRESLKYTWHRRREKAREAG